jgi:hypothetical protein
MWDVAIVILIVAAAAGFAAWRIVRRLKGKGGCASCAMRSHCPVARQDGGADAP